MSVTPLIHKTHDNNNGVDAGDGFSDWQVEAICLALARWRAEIRDETEAAIAEAIAKLHAETDLTERIAELRGQVGVLLNLRGGNGGNDNNNLKLFEASETVRKVKLQNAPKRTRQPKVVNQAPTRS